MQYINCPECPIDRRKGHLIYENVVDAYFGTPGNWSYRQNPETKHLWLDPRPDDQGIGELYINYYTHDEPERGDSIWDTVFEFIQASRLGYPAANNPSVFARFLSLMPTIHDAAELGVMRISAYERGRILDFGCGSGAFMSRMRDAGWSVTGVELDAKAAAQLRASKGFIVYSSVDELIDKNRDPFDVIVMGHVLEHVSDPVSTLSTLKNLLSESGRLIITTPNANSLASKLFRQYWRGLEPPRHFNVFTLTSLSNALKRGGLRLVKIRTEVRTARTIWFLSYLARRGDAEMKKASRSSYVFLKLYSYGFQLLEAAISYVYPESGEEIFCVATRE
jgi:SAM-dependent methyltransferase